MNESYFVEVAAGAPDKLPINPHNRRSDSDRFDPDDLAMLIASFRSGLGGEPGASWGAKNKGEILGNLPLTSSSPGKPKVRPFSSLHFSVRRLRRGRRAGPEFSLARSHIVYPFRSRSGSRRS